ncbi:MAG TPA: DegT/DnrJ/EryC1/StrS family aminotransferase [Solirubrobacterales bacterium]|nr:DegT/DnrJ/EryC1/StrS family aminotransferase [Solirubrobacterales bacterium]
MSQIPVMRPTIGREEAEAAAAAVASGWVAQGPRVAEFERAFAARVGSAEAVAVSSGTAALHVALELAGVGPGDDVVVPSLSFIATANAVRCAGATPVFADVELETQNLTPATVAERLTPCTRAVVLVHQAGVPADIEAMHDLLDPLGVALVEDAACAAGATYRGAPIGSHSDHVAFSFHPRKLLTTGEGGMLAVSSGEISRRGRRLREHGMSVGAAERSGAEQVVVESYLESGFNYRMTDIQAAVGLVQLQRLEGIVARRRERAGRYGELLAGIPGLRTIADPLHGRTNFQSYWVLLPEECPTSRLDLLGRLLEAGVSARRGIMAAHLEPAYRGHPHGPLPNTEKLATRSVILPLHDELDDAAQDRVVEAFASALGVAALR